MPRNTRAHPSPSGHTSLPPPKRQDRARPSARAETPTRDSSSVGSASGSSSSTHAGVKKSASKAAARQANKKMAQNLSSPRGVSAVSGITEACTSLNLGASSGDPAVSGNTEACTSSNLGASLEDPAVSGTTEACSSRDSDSSELSGESMEDIQIGSSLQLLNTDGDAEPARRKLRTYARRGATLVITEHNHVSEAGPGNMNMFNVFEEPMPEPCMENLSFEERAHIEQLMAPPAGQVGPNHPLPNWQDDTADLIRATRVQREATHVARRHADIDRDARRYHPYPRRSPSPRALPVPSVRSSSPLPSPLPSPSSPAPEELPAEPLTAVNTASPGQTGATVEPASAPEEGMADTDSEFSDLEIPSEWLAEVEEASTNVRADDSAAQQMAVVEISDDTSETDEDTDASPSEVSVDVVSNREETSVGASWVASGPEIAVAGAASPVERQIGGASALPITNQQNGSGSGSGRVSRPGDKSLRSSESRRAPRPESARTPIRRLACQQRAKTVLRTGIDRLNLRTQLATLVAPDRRQVASRAVDMALDSDPVMFNTYLDGFESWKRQREAAAQANAPTPRPSVTSFTMPDASAPRASELRSVLYPTASGIVARVAGARVDGRRQSSSSGSVSSSSEESDIDLDAPEMEQLTAPELEAVAAGPAPEVEAQANTSPAPTRAIMAVRRRLNAMYSSAAAGFRLSGEIFRRISPFNNNNNNNQAQPRPRRPIGFETLRPVGRIIPPAEPWPTSLGARPHPPPICQWPEWDILRYPPPPERPLGFPPPGARLPPPPPVTQPRTREVEMTERDAPPARAEDTPESPLDSPGRPFSYAQAFADLAATTAEQQASNDNNNNNNNRGGSTGAAWDLNTQRDEDFEATIAGFFNAWKRK